MRFYILLFTLTISFTTLAQALDVSPDGPLIVNLRDDATSVIVGNPAHASVSLENSRMLIINAGIPGATNLTVLGSDGRVIMNEKIIVNGASQGYVRVKNACINGGGDCRETTMYYCEEGSSCHNVIVATEPPMTSVSGPVESATFSEDVIIDDEI